MERIKYDSTRLSNSDGMHTHFSAHALDFMQGKKVVHDGNIALPKRR